MAGKTRANEPGSESVKRPASHPTNRISKHPSPQAAPALALQRAMSATLSTLGPADILALQRSVGNRTIQRLMTEQVQRLTLVEEKEKAGQRKSITSFAAPLAHRKSDKLGEGVEAAGADPANKTALPDELKAGIESLSGVAMDDVVVHYNSSRPAQLRAVAYTQASEIHLGPGQEQHLPHEAWHVVQQRQGRVKPTIQMAGESINDDIHLEKEADLMGARAAQRNVLQLLHYRSHAVPDPSQPLQMLTAGLASSKTIQRLTIGDDEDEVSMEDAASHIQGASTQSTTAIAEPPGEDDDYVVYAQTRTAGMQGRIDEYDNLEVGGLNAGTGFHAEVIALQDSTDYSSLAASQTICARCEALLGEQGIGAVNPDGHFTRLWSAPWDNAIDENSPYPYGADGGGGTGKNGTRWGFRNDAPYQIARITWIAAHPNGW